MQFKTDKPIYQQIVDYAYARILADDWTPGQRVPSVRELSVEMSVNTHTILKAFDYLTDRGIIAARRGMGFYLEPDAKKKINDDRRRNFFDEILPDLFEQMRLLGITIEDIVRSYSSDK